MNWVAIAQYVLARTKEPSIVHRGVQAVGGLIAAWALTGPERWIGVILSVSALVGILMPDAVQKPVSGWNDASSVSTEGSVSNDVRPVDRRGESVSRSVREPPASLPAKPRIGAVGPSIDERPPGDQFGSSWGDR